MKYALAILLALPTTAYGGYGHQVIVQQQQVIQPVVVPFLYSTVSPYLVAAADDSRIEKAVDRRLAQLGITGTLQQKAPSNLQHTRQCADCHDGRRAKKDGNPTFNIEHGLNDRQKVRWMEMLGLGINVPPEMQATIDALKANGGADVTAEILRGQTGVLK